MKKITDIFLNPLTAGLLEACKEFRKEGYVHITFSANSALVMKNIPSEPVQIPTNINSRMLLAILELALGKKAADDVAKGGKADGRFEEFRLSASGTPQGDATIAIRFH